MRKQTSFVLNGLVALLVVSVGSAQQTPLPGSAIPQFVDPLPVLEVSGGPIRTLVADANEIELHMREFRANMLPSTFAPGTYAGTWVFGYIEGPNPPMSPVGTYTGPAIIATRGVPTQIRFVNDLGDTSTTHVQVWKNSIDQTLHWADPLGGEMNMCNHMIMPGLPPEPSCGQPYSGPIPAVPHLHGGYVPPVLDGGPDAWFTSDGLIHGHGYYTHPNVPAAANACVYRYPNDQEAAPTWFHDHLLGGTRINVYAGLAGAYAVIDPALHLPTGLNAIGLQQGAHGAVEPLIPLVIQDRMFDTDGQLFFPAGLPDSPNPEHPFWVPEFVGDTIAVNGKVWPYLNVQPKRYRFLIVNGSNARTYELFLANQSTGRLGPSIWQIGTDGGYLDYPVEIDPTGCVPSMRKLLMQPGERADVIIDFGRYAGKTLLLRNTGITPYPSGDVPDDATLGRIIQFRVQTGQVNDRSYNPACSIALRPPMVRLVNPWLGTVACGVHVDKTRQLTLNEVEDDPVPPYEGGPEEVLVNNTKWEGRDAHGNPRPDFTPVTINGVTNYYSEFPAEGTTEVWEIVNLTMDAHPIHTHLVQFQLINRQRFDDVAYAAAYAAAFPGGAYIPAGGPPLDYNTGNPRALGGNPDIRPFLRGCWSVPKLNEAGWKDTIMSPPGYVTRIAVRYAPQYKPIRSNSLQFSFDPNVFGHGYVWHCHIVDHEDNEMMRPYIVVPKPGVVRTYVQGTDY